MLPLPMGSLLATTAIPARKGVARQQSPLERRRDKSYTYISIMGRVCLGGSVAGHSERTRLGDVFTRAEALECGISKRRLYALRDAGDIVGLGAGLFRWSDAEPAELDLIEIAERVPLATLCLETALARHELIDSIPAAIDVAIPRGAHRPHLTAVIRLHQFGTTTFELGRETMTVGARRPLGIYSAERSLVDVIRLRHAMGPELAWEALRRWLQRSGSEPSQLVAIASHFKGAEAPIRAALEVLL
jgi:hypothetical protein